MSWTVNYAEPATPREHHKPPHRQKPEQIEFYHTDQDEHFIYIGQSNGDGAFFGVAYVGEAHPDAVVTADEREEFDDWAAAREWRDRMMQFYEDGLDPDAPDVFDGREAPQQ